MVDEEGEGCTNPVTQPPGDVGGVNGHNDELTIVDGEFRLQIFGVILQLENTFRSPHPAIKDKCRREATHELAQLLHIAVLVRQLKVREFVARN